MRIIIDMEIESPDYGGKEFKKEIEKLITDIDSSGSTSLIKFKMRQKFGFSDSERDIDYINEAFEFLIK